MSRPQRDFVCTRHWSGDILDAGNVGRFWDPEHPVVVWDDGRLLCCLSLRLLPSLVAQRPAESDASCAALQTMHS